MEGFDDVWEVRVSGGRRLTYVETQGALSLGNCCEHDVVLRQPYAR